MVESGGRDLGPLTSQIGKRQHPQALKVGEKRELLPSQSGGQGAKNQRELLSKRIIDGVVRFFANKVATRGDDPYFIDKIWPEIEKKAKRLGMTTEELAKRIKEVVEI